MPPPPAPRPFFQVRRKDTKNQRVQGWLLLDNYPPTLVLTLAYLLIVWLGPRYMRARQPVSCRRLLVVYNLVLTLLSFYMFYEAIWFRSRLVL
ncbi:hypothetical protein CRUP_035425 [Coryphaenoides rupestris]|nr:hypothetical protein CRUP_035425 [Coryphaenoides rupestris]